MAPHIYPRQESVVTTHAIAAGLIAGFLSLLAISCLLCRLRSRRSRANKQRIQERNAASWRVRGVVQPVMAETNPMSTSIPPPFSRHALTASIVMPEKSITRKPSSHALPDNMVVSCDPEPSPASPPPSRHRPLSSASSGAPRPHAMSILNPSCPRHSRSSSGFAAFAQLSFPSGMNSRPSSSISTSSTQARPVRQLFESALPDELSIVRYGEYLSVLRSFDDGWCLVARDTSRFSRSSRASRLSAWMKNNADHVEIGLVPAWVFIKPLKGITVTRPFRNASINALHLGQNPAPTYAREDIISWSNFA